MNHINRARQAVVSLVVLISLLLGMARPAFAGGGDDEIVAQAGSAKISVSKPAANPQGPSTQGALPDASFQASTGLELLRSKRAYATVHTNGDNPQFDVSWTLFDDSGESFGPFVSTVPTNTQYLRLEPKQQLDKIQHTQWAHLQANVVNGPAFGQTDVQWLDQGAPQWVTPRQVSNNNESCWVVDDWHNDIVINRTFHWIDSAGQPQSAKAPSYEDSTGAKEGTSDPYRLPDTGSRDIEITIEIVSNRASDAADVERHRGTYGGFFNTCLPVTIEKSFAAHPVNDCFQNYEVVIDERKGVKSIAWTIDGVAVEQPKGNLGQAQTAQVNAHVVFVDDTAQDFPFTITRKTDCPTYSASADYQINCSQQYTITNEISNPVGAVFSWQGGRTGTLNVGENERTVNGTATFSDGHTENVSVTIKRVADCPTNPTNGVTLNGTCPTKDKDSRDLLLSGTAIIDNAPAANQTVILTKADGKTVNVTTGTDGKFTYLYKDAKLSIGGTVVATFKDKTDSLVITKEMFTSCVTTRKPDYDIELRTFKTCWGTIVQLVDETGGRSPYIKTLGLTQDFAAYDMAYGQFIWIPRWVTTGGFNVEIGMVIDADLVTPGEQAVIWKTTRGIPGFTNEELTKCQKWSITCDLLTVKLQQPDGNWDDLAMIEQYIWGSTGTATLFRGNIALGTDSGSYKDVPLVWGNYDSNGWPTWHNDPKDHSWYNGAGLYRLMGGAVAVNPASPWLQIDLHEDSDNKVPVCNTTTITTIKKICKNGQIIEVPSDSPETGDDSCTPPPPPALKDRCAGLDADGVKIIEKVDANSEDLDSPACTAGDLIPEQTVTSQPRSMGAVLALMAHLMIIALAFADFLKARDRA